MTDQPDVDYHTQLHDMGFDTNRHGEIVNGTCTFEALAQSLDSGPVMLGWTDEAGSMLQVLFARPRRFGAPGGGLDMNPRKLMVAVVGHGCYGFGSETAPDYIREKLKVSGGTATKLCELINEVLKRR